MRTLRDKKMYPQNHAENNNKNEDGTENAYFERN